MSQLNYVNWIEKISKISCLVKPTNYNSIFQFLFTVIHHSIFINSCNVSYKRCQALQDSLYFLNEYVISLFEPSFDIYPKLHDRMGLFIKLFMI